MLFKKHSKFFWTLAAAVVALVFIAGGSFGSQGFKYGFPGIVYAGPEPVLKHRKFTHIVPIPYEVTVFLGKGKTETIEKKPVFVKWNHKKDRIEELREKIDSVLLGVNCDVSVQVVSASKYDLIYEYKPGMQMIPASISKVITSAIALKYLGIGYEFKTVLYTDDGDLSDGVINGNLYIKGYGDPEFDMDGVINLVNQFTGKNINEITGNVVYDDSYFDDKYKGLADYYSGDTKGNYWPYVCALTFEKNKGSSNPPYAAADFLVSVLKEKNVKVEGAIVAGITPVSAKEIGKETHPLPLVMANMNKPSDNHSAITIFKCVGADFGQPPGTLEKGSTAVIEFLTSLGIPRNDFEILEGSGLTRHNLVNSNLYIQLLKYLYDREDIFDAFYQSLTVAGVDGTLKSRMIGTEAEKNVHAKTGTLNGVSTLTGYAVTRDGELLIFYIAMNGFGTANPKPYRSKQDEICELLCGFSRK